jgi:hypothetical protein
MNTAPQQIERAMELRRRDRLAHLWADMAVAVAMDQMRQDRGYQEAQERPHKFAHDAATLATTILIEQLITKDQAIATLRQQLEAHKQQLETLIRLTPAPVVIRSITNPDEEHGQ